MRFITFCFLIMSFYSLAQDNPKEPTEKEGYVALPIIISGATPESISITGASFFDSGYKIKELVSGNNFKLITLPVGNYKWKRIKLNDSYYFNLEDLEFNISVKKGVVNYSGHLIIDINNRYATANYRYINRSSQTLEELKSCCEEIISDYPLVFTAKSQDPFIDAIKQATIGSSN